MPFTVRAVLDTVDAPAVPAARPRRLALVSALVAALVAVLALTGLTAAGPASAAVRSAGASTAHPYSDPVYWPLSAPSSMDCYKSNPGSGCGGVHAQYLWDIIGEHAVNTQPVYAMGAGIAHVGARHAGCGRAQGRGNYLYIDHGNGVLTYYGHLGSIFVRTGQYVTARTRLAYVGNSGYARCHVYPKLRYLMVALKHGGTGGKYVEITHTYACATGSNARVDYPRQLPHGARSRWNAVHRTTPVPATSVSRTCAPVPPHTAPRPAHVAVHKHGTALTVSWARAASAYRVSRSYVTLSMYHPTAKHWSVLRTRSVGAKTHSVGFRALLRNRHYRVNVQFHNSAGYSALSRTRTASIGR